MTFIIQMLEKTPQWNKNVLYKTITDCNPLAPAAIVSRSIEAFKRQLRDYPGAHQTISLLGGGPRVVVSTAAFYARVRGSVPIHV